MDLSIQEDVTMQCLQLISTLLFGVIHSRECRSDSLMLLFLSCARSNIQASHMFNVCPSWFHVTDQADPQFFCFGTDETMSLAPASRVLRAVIHTRLRLQYSCYKLKASVIVRSTVVTPVVLDPKLSTKVLCSRRRSPAFLDR